MAVERLIIVGSGPAGWTGALYAARAELRPVVLAGQEPGGQLTLTTMVENYPGFPDGILGTELITAFRKQAERFGARVVSEEVVAVDFSRRPLIVKTAKAEFQTEAVIITTGASALWLGVPGEKEYKGRGVSACATCDGFFFKGKRVAVVGGGDSAMEEANFLTKFADRVSILVRRDALKASKIMQERTLGNPKIELRWNTEVREIIGDGQRMTGLKVFNNQTSQETELVADGLFVAIGHKPNTEIFAGQIDLDIKGYVVVEAGSTKTSVAGVFAAGDVADHVYRQAVTAAGTGCMAALDAERWLSARK